MKTKEEIFGAFHNLCDALGAMPDEMRIYFRVGLADSYINVDFIKDWNHKNGSRVTVNDYTGILWTHGPEQTREGTDG